jgi:hypothetical protein
MIVVGLITGCSTSIKEQEKDTVKDVSRAFTNQSETAKKESKQLRFYLPFGMSIKKESPNNVIIKKGGQDYILFYNQKEDEKSQEVYKISKPVAEGILVDKEFTSKKRFGYLLISKVKENLYEITVGIGGIKMTTETTLKNIANDAGKMMKIVSSVKYKK